MCKEISFVNQPESFRQFDNNLPGNEDFKKSFTAQSLESPHQLDKLPGTRFSKNSYPVPMFECKDGVQKISYTLVCNFRQDCRDSSDEDLCIFAPCTVTEFTCRNGQVRTSDNKLSTLTSIVSRKVKG